MSAMGKFELFKSAKNDQFYFHLEATNGQIILASEGYKAKAGAENGIKSVRENAAIPERFEKRDNKNGDPYFVLKAANGQIIGMSEMYEGGAKGRDNGIASVAKNAPDAKLVDLTLEDEEEAAEPAKKKARRHGKFQLFKSDKNDQFYFRLKASNGEIILASEGYKAKAGAENGIKSVQENAAIPERFDKRENKNGDPYFVLKAANGEIIGVSEMYESGVKNRDHGIASVAFNAPEGKVEDLTLSAVGGS